MEIFNNVMIWLVWRAINLLTIAFAATCLLLFYHSVGKLIFKTMVRGGAGLYQVARLLL